MGECGAIVSSPHLLLFASQSCGVLAPAVSTGGDGSDDNDDDSRKGEGGAQEKKR